MLTVTVHHNTDGRFTPYQDGHQLIAVTSHRLPADADRDPQAVADSAYHAFNADLDHLETSRDTIHGETTFLAACVYRLLGHRSLSVGDVFHVQAGQDNQWLACDPFGWRRINPPSNVGGTPLTAAKVYEHLRSQRATSEPAPELFTKEQVGDALNQAADEILDAVNAGDEGLAGLLPAATKVEVVVVRDPDAANDYEIFVDGQRRPDGATDRVQVITHDIDLGAAEITPTWVAEQLQWASETLSPAARRHAHEAVTRYADDLDPRDGEALA